MNQKEIEQPLSYVPVYLNEIGEYQEQAYNLIIRSFESNLVSFDTMEGFGYTVLLGPLASLIIVYPNEVLDKMIKDSDNKEGDESNSKIISTFIGESGLNTVMTYIEQKPTEANPIPLRHSFQYKPEVLKRYGPIFKPEIIHRYSAKIAEIGKKIKESKGIILIYSQFIDGGAVPLALALEELGFSRYSTGQHKNLFKKPPTEVIDAISMKPKSEHLAEGIYGDFRPAKYMMITGHKEFSPDNYSDVNYLTSADNINGEKIKVVIISKAAAEGLDFKHIRQVHILEPWYNMNRIEQIIGRGVRNGSHCKLPFEERNVEIYLHGSLTSTGEEAADLYVYRLAEKKAMKTGQVTRLLKEIAVDCILNISQTNLTEEGLFTIAENQNLSINLPSGKTVPFKVGDKPYTDICDYMHNCFSKCSSKLREPSKIDTSTYDENFMKTSMISMIRRIRELFREKSIYSKEQLFTAINIVKTYPEEQIYYALTKFIDSKSEVLIDKYGRSGNMINRGEYYLFQPNEITDQNASVYERTVPVDYKREKLLLELPPEGAQKAVLHNQGKAEEDESEQGQTADSSKAQEVITKLNECVTTVFKNPVKLKGSERDWYLHANNILEELMRFIPLADIRKYIIYHFLDMLPYPEKLAILKHIFSKGTDDIPHDTAIHIRSYFEDKFLAIRNTRGIVLVNGLQLVYLIQSLEESDIWEKARAEDEDRMLTEFKKQIISLDIMFPMIGFIHLFNPNIGMSFKIKNMVTGKQNKNNKGARADQAPKPDLVNKLNMVLEFEEDIYSMDKMDNMRTIGLSVMIEIIMRYKTDKDGANMFFNTELALVNRVIDL